METIVIVLLLCILVYELCIFIWFTPGQSQRQKSAETATVVEKPTATDDDIMGKSKFDMKEECRLMRQRKEESERKAAIAKGEMTEDGSEIAQEVKPEDCEVEQKPVWKQVPNEEIPDMFAEPDVPLAKGDPLNDVDLTFGVRKNLDKEEEREVSEKMYKLFDDTIVLDDICDQAPEVGREIRWMIDKYKKEMFKTEEQKPEVEGIVQKRFSMKDRYADFDVEDLV